MAGMTIDPQEELEAAAQRLADRAFLALTKELEALDPSYRAAVPMVWIIALPRASTMSIAVVSTAPPEQVAQLLRDTADKAAIAPPDQPPASVM